MIIKAIILVIASVAAFKVSLISVHCFRKPSPAAVKPPPDGSNFKQFEEEEEEEEMEGEEEDIKHIKSKMKKDLKLNFPGPEKKLNSVTELEVLHNLVKELNQRKVNLEEKLFKLHGISQLRNTLEDKKAEINMLNITINSLQIEIKHLQEEMKQGFLEKKQVEMAKEMTVDMQEKMQCSNGNWVKEQLVVLREKVSRNQREDGFVRDNMIGKEIKVGKDVELKVAEMRRRNKELELEKRELKVKLVAAKARIAALSNMTETKITAEINVEITNLKQANEELSKQIEKLQKNRFCSVEKLVYQRWLNSCMRFEVQNHKTPSRKSSKDLGKNPPGLDSHYISSTSSHISSSESTEFDSTIFESSSSSHGRKSMKSGLIHKLRKWGRSKDGRSVGSAVSSSSGSSSGGNSMIRSGLIRRFSMSMVPSTSKKKFQESIECANTPSNFPRVRRVSFNDSVETFASTIEDCIDDQKELLSATHEISENSSNMRAASHHEDEFVAQKREQLLVESDLGNAGNSSDSSGKCFRDERVDVHVAAGRIEIDTNSTARFNFIVAFFLFLFMSLVYLYIAGSH